MSRWIAAIDQGTTSTRCIVFDAAGSIVTTAQKEHRQLFPQPGWVEHDALEIWRNTETVVAAAVAQSKLPLEECAAIGITNQRETTVVWNRRTGQPVCNAIVWQDTRVNDWVQELVRQGVQEHVRVLTGLPLASYFSALKAKWILESVSGARAAAEAGELAFGTIDSWLLFNLTQGEHRTDVTNASRTQLMNLKTLDWDDELLNLFSIPRAMLPSIVASSGELGVTKCTALAGVPITGILGDQQAALVGQACFAPGNAKNTYGTGCFMLLNTGEKIVASKAGLLTTVAYRFGAAKPVYALEGSIAIAGALVQWLRDNLGLIGSSTEVEAVAKSVDDNGDVYFVPAFSGLYAPHWREDARGVIAGLTRFANRGHLARAALEATAYQTRDVLDAMELDAGIRLNELRVDGGMVVNELLMQFQADLLNVPVVRPTVIETTALGAAYAAGLQVGLWRSLDELKSQWREARRWQPEMIATRREELYGSWRKAIERSLDWR